VHDDERVRCTKAGVGLRSEGAIDERLQLGGIDVLRE